MATINSVLQVILPKRKSSPTGTAYTNTFNPTSTETALSTPTYRNHLQDIFTNRTSQDSRAIIKDLAKYDSDVSATIQAYLNVSDTDISFYVYNENGELDQAGQEALKPILGTLFRRYDYSTGFAITKTLREVAENYRYMLLATGAIATEMVFNKQLQPAEMRIIDPTTLEWYEKTPGVYKPQQRPAGSSEPINLDIPTFFFKSHRQNPTEIYTESMFVSSINTIAARQQVINDLYRIMQKTGYPRMDVSVTEEVLRKNVPASIATNEKQIRDWVNARLGEIAAQITDLRADAAFVHTDAVEASIINESGPGKSMDVTSIINVLNAQNQAALKVLPTFIGRGESGVNTATVEARVFSMACDSLNGPVADLLSEMLTLALRLTGYAGYVECYFAKVELRPLTELEAQFTMRQARLQNDLSLGIITDNEYHIEMYNRPKPSTAPDLSGTGFLQPVAASGPDASKATPNSDTLGRSITPDNANAAKSNGVRKPAANR